MNSNTSRINHGERLPKTAKEREKVRCRKNTVAIGVRIVRLSRDIHGEQNRQASN